MIVPSNRSAIQGDSAVEDEIALEPTRSAGFDSAPSADSSGWGATSTSLATSFVNDTAKLLRSRLLLVALFYGAIIGVRYLFSVFVPDSGEGLAAGSLAARAFFSFAVAGLLASRQIFSLKQLRAIEYLFFGVHLIVLLVVQYLISSELILRGDAVGVIAFDKNGVIRIIVLMLLYGVVIPNDPKVTARVVLTMAIGPPIILALLTQVYAANGTMVAQMVTGEMAASNAVFVVLGAAVAIFAAYVVNGLRQDLHDAKHVGQYELGHKLGEGGMGEVYLAEHELLKRTCALKLIHADHRSNPATVARFQREVQSAAKLSHPNTIEIFDYGHTDDGTFYYVMEYLPGMNLADLVGQFGPLPPGRAIYLMRQVCKSLAEAHCHGIVHRDLKPANIFLAILGGECDVAKVLDFGLVKLTASSDSPQLTTDFTVSGTPWFMSPEQATCVRGIDGRADIYSIGAVLYFALTGKPPFDKETPAAVMAAHASEPIRPPSQMGFDVPGDLEAVVLKCLAKTPADRFACAREVAMALGSCRCAADWDDARAERWWLEQADKHASSEETVVP
jgi:eukaryotic-like serine/threonine-protein kinase